MTGNSDEDINKIKTGGGAYVGGNVGTSGGEFIGRDKVTTAGAGGVAVGGNMTGSNVITGDNNVATNQQGITQEALLQLLAEMRGLIHQAGLEERKARIIEGDVQVVEEEAKTPKPDSAIIAGKLEGMTKILEAAGNLTESGKKLLGHAKQALTWVGLLL